MGDPKNLFGDIKRAQEEMEHLMQHMIGQTLPLLYSAPSKWRPNVDVFESGDSIIVVAELAGVEREDVSVIYDAGKLIISGVRRDMIPHKNKRYCQMEINYNAFERILLLPEEVEVEQISAKLNNGFIIIDAPKKKAEPPKNQQIEIG